MNMDCTDEEDDTERRQADEYDEWLPGELEYYQEMCNEIYPPVKTESTSKIVPEVEECAQNEEEDTEGIVSDAEADTTYDISFVVSDAEIDADEDEDNRSQTEEIVNDAAGNKSCNSNSQ